jgi:hypothetical protein
MSDPREPTRRSLPSVFDALPPGPINFVLLYERMERDFEARTLATLDRVLAPQFPAGPSSPSGNHTNHRN